MAARLVPCPDARALEEVFLDELAAGAAARTDPFGPLWIVTPTRVLLDRLQLSAARRLGAVAGVVWLTYRGLGQRIVEAAGAEPVAVLPPAAWESVVGSAASSGGGALAAWVARFGGATATLAATLRELRLAGVDLEALPPRPLAPAARELAAHLRRALERDVGDEASLFAQARELVSSRLPPVVHAGAYDLTGVVAELFRELALAVDVVHLALGMGSGLEALAFADERGAAFGAATREEARPFGGPWAARLRALDGAESVTPFDVDLVEAPGPAEELAAAARRCLSWAEQGIPLEEQAIVARSLEPYEGHLRTVLGAWRLPFFTTAETPLARQPAAHALRDLLQLLAGDLPRAPLARLLSSPCLRPGAFGIAFSPGRLDVLMRRMDYRGGGRELADRLPATVRQQEGGRWRHDVEDAAHLAVIAAELAEATSEGRRAGTIPELVAFVRAVAGRYLVEVGSGRDLAAAVAAVCRLGDLDGLVPAPGDLRKLVVWAERALALQTARITPRDGGGVRVLDMMQARGLSFRAVALLGLHAGSLPRLGREDPLLPDEARVAISHAAGRRVAQKGSTEAEERLLLALVLSAAQERLLLCRQSVDEAQRGRAPSPWLPAILRAAGSQVPSTIVPRHPLGAALQAASRDGLLTASEAVVAAALASSGADAPIRARDAALELGVADDVLLAGLVHTARVESPGAGGSGDELPDAQADAAALEFDGVAAPPSGELALTASALERLVRCPMRSFLQDRLGVQGHPRPEESPLVDRRRLGNAVHALLEEVYAGLAWDASVASILASSGRRLDAALGRMEASLAAGLLGSYPPVLRAVVAAVASAVRDLVAWDVPRLALGGVAGIRTEERFDAILPLEGAAVALRGRLDRHVLHADGGAEIGDYKTATSAEVADSWIRPRRILATGRIQLAAYGLAERTRRTSLALLHVPVTLPPAPSDRRHHVLDRATLQAHAPELRAAMASAVAVERQGRYPLTRYGPDVCRACDYRDACRYDHALTLERVRGAGPFAAYFAERERGDG